jgi:hypothetical protein
MKTINKKIIMLAILSVTLFSSCMTTKTSVGGYDQTEGKSYKYAKGKQLWLFWGIIPLGRTNVNTPEDGNCQVITRFNIGDFFIGAFTGGIITSYSIKIKAKK